jgi:hypothetical protein
MRTVPRSSVSGVGALTVGMVVGNLRILSSVSTGAVCTVRGDSQNVRRRRVEIGDETALKMYGGMRRYVFVKDHREV